MPDRCAPTARAVAEPDVAARQTAPQDAWFRALLQSAASAAAPEAVPLSEERWRQLVDVNRDINAAIEIGIDKQIYGAAEFWALPLSAPPPDAGARPRGDCEDYVLEKRLRLLALGWPPKSLSIAMVHAPFLGLHVVLIAHTGDGDYVLDNTLQTPVRIETLRYRWLSRQTGAELLRWSRFSGPSASGAVE